MSMNRESATFYIDDLNLFSWFFHILPYMLRRRVGGMASEPIMYFFEGTGLGEFVARKTARLVGVRIERLSFRLVDIKDKRGALMWLGIRYCGDLSKAVKAIVKGVEFQGLLQEEAIVGKMPTYLYRDIAKTELVFLSRKFTIGYAMYLIRVAAWDIEKRKVEDKQGAVLFLSDRSWMWVIREYAVEHGVEIRTMFNWDLFNLSRIKLNLIARLSPSSKAWARRVRDFCYLVKVTSLPQAVRLVYKSDKEAKRNAGSRKILNNPPFKIATNFYGHLNMAQPELYSDLFFWQRSRDLLASDIIMLFGSPSDRLDRDRFAMLEKYGLSAIALSPIATTDPTLPTFFRWSRKGKGIPAIKGEARSNEQKDLRRGVVDFHMSYDFWLDLFARLDIRCFTTWFKYSADHCVMADALAELGGVFTIYQRAAEVLPAPELAITADIYFGFSSIAADFERGSNSTIPYYVVTGYLGDHRFPLLRDQAQQVRDQLHGRGVKRIIAFFDESSGADDRWHTGHGFMQDNYRFLLEKVLAEDWFGLVLKPKMPTNLRERLADVAELLQEAEESGRCFIYQEGSSHGAFPPAGAALSADIAIHGHLCAATAGIESALAGVPTLLLDREGWPDSYLYELGVGNAVFANWEDLWGRCQEHWAAKGGGGPLGDWSPLLDSIDPFRDGGGAERMGDYLKWVLNGLNEGLGRETVLADAAERYCRAWGQDKVIDVRPELGFLDSRN
jgi:hypothetical protein